MFNYRVTKQDTAMKLRNMQRKMLKKAIKGHKKGALPFAIEQTENVGGGKTAMILDIARDHGMDDVLFLRHAPVRDWSLEPTIKKCVITVNKDVLAAGIVEPEDVFTIPLHSPALYAQCIGRIKRITPEQAQAEMEANIQGPSMADLIKQGYLKPLTARCYLENPLTGEKIEGSEFTPGKKDDDQ